MTNNPYPAPIAPIARKKRVWPWVLLVVFVVIIGGFTACTALVGAAVNKVGSDAKKPVTVTYSVTGQGTASITYDTSTEAGISTENANDTSLPWTKDVSVSGFVKTPHVIATLGADGGSVTCSIAENGRVLKTATSKGPFASATCMADLPNN